MILVRGGASIVLVTPDPVPDRRHGRGKDEHNRSVVHAGSLDRDERGHAEQWHSQQGPSYDISKTGLRRTKPRGEGNAPIATTLQKAPRAPR